jgi:hypothetical protein
MAEGDGLIYNNFKEMVMEGVFNLGTGGDTIKTILVSGHTPDIDTHDEYTDVSADEYGAGLGYTVGGETLAGQDVTQNNTADRGEYDGTDETWTSLGPLAPATPTDAIQYDDTPTTPTDPITDPLMASWELGVKATNGGDFTLQWGTNGIILLT